MREIMDELVDIMKSNSAAAITLPILSIFVLLLICYLLSKVLPWLAETISKNGMKLNILGNKLDIPAAPDTKNTPTESKPAKPAKQSADKIIKISVSDMMTMISKCVSTAIEVINTKNDICKSISDAQKLDTRTIMDNAISTIQVAYRNKLRNKGTEVLGDPSVLLFNARISTEFHEKIYPKLYDIYKSEDLARKGTLEINDLCASLSNTAITLLRSNIISYMGCDIESMESSIKECSAAITNYITDAVTKAKITAIEGSNKISIKLSLYNDEINDTIEAYSKERSELVLFTENSILNKTGDIL